MASPYTRYSGQRVQPLPAGYIEGYARGGAGWGQGFAGVGKGIGEAIEKYRRNKEESDNARAGAEMDMSQFGMMQGPDGTFFELDPNDPNSAEIAAQKVDELNEAIGDKMLNKFMEGKTTKGDDLGISNAIKSFNKRKTQAITDEYNKLLLAERASLANINLPSTLGGAPKEEPLEKGVVLPPIPPPTETLGPITPEEKSEDDTTALRALAGGLPADGPADFKKRPDYHLMRVDQLARFGPIPYGDEYDLEKFMSRPETSSERRFYEEAARNVGGFGRLTEAAQRPIPDLAPWVRERAAPAPPLPEPPAVPVPDTEGRVPLTTQAQIDANEKILMEAKVHLQNAAANADRARDIVANRGLDRGGAEPSPPPKGATPPSTSYHEHLAAAIAAHREKGNVITPAVVKGIEDRLAAHGITKSPPLEIVTKGGMNVLMVGGEMKAWMPTPKLKPGFVRMDSILIPNTNDVQPVQYMDDGSMVIVGSPRTMSTGEIDRGFKVDALGPKAYAFSKQRADSLRQQVSDIKFADDSVKKLIAISNMKGEELKLARRGMAKSITATMIGRLRVTLMGPGVLSNEDVKRIELAIPDPTKILAFDEEQTAALHQTLGSLNSGLLNDIGAHIEGGLENVILPAWHPAAKQQKDLREGNKRIKMDEWGKRIK